MPRTVTFDVRAKSMRVSYTPLLCNTHKPCGNSTWHQIETLPLVEARQGLELHPPTNENQTIQSNNSIK